MTQPRTRSLRPSLVTPAIVQHGLTAQAAPRSPSAVMAQAARAEGIITEQIVVVRRPFATVQARVIEVLKAGRLLDTLVLSGPDVGLAVRLEVGPGFPWDVLV